MMLSPALAGEPGEMGVSLANISGMIVGPAESDTMMVQSLVTVLEASSETEREMLYSLGSLASCRSVRFRCMPFTWPPWKNRSMNSS